jgi:hypothetical protein
MLLIRATLIILTTTVMLGVVLGLSLGLGLALVILAPYLGAGVVLAVGVAGVVRVVELRLAARNEALRLVLAAQDRDRARQFAAAQAPRPRALVTFEGEWYDVTPGRID